MNGNENILGNEPENYRGQWPVLDELISDDFDYDDEDEDDDYGDEEGEDDLDNSLESGQSAISGLQWFEIDGEALA